MTKAEEKVVRYAESVNWDYEKIAMFISDNISYIQYESLQGESLRQKTDYIINKFKPKMETKTKVTVLGEEPKKELRKIEFIYSVIADSLGQFGVSKTQIPETWDNVILLCRKYNQTNLDLMAASDDNSHNFCLFLGNWNDGIV